MKENVTVLLQKVQEGDKASLDRLLPIVYNELRIVAKGHLRSERSDHTLQATALVHEAYVRLLDQKSVDWENSSHFFSIASEMMRRILVNYAIKRNAKKRGDGATRVELDEAINYSKDQNSFDVVGLDEALKSLAEFDEKQAKIVELRFFGGLTIGETAKVVGISDSTVKREWRMAKAWIKTRL